MPQFSNLASLRGGLTADDPDRRAEAYSAVLNADLQPSQVLESSPEDDVVETLVDAEVIPASAGGGRQPINQRWERIEELLERIVENTEGQ